MEELTLTTPSLLFSAISLILLAYTNRFLSYASVVRHLKDKYDSNPQSDPTSLKQIKNLFKRLRLIRAMQILGAASLLLCITAMFFIYIKWMLLADWIFGLGMVLLAASLCVCIWEIQISVQALELNLDTIRTQQKDREPIVLTRKSNKQRDRDERQDNRRERQSQNNANDNNGGTAYNNGNNNKKKQQQPKNQQNQQMQRSNSGQNNKEQRSELMNNTQLRADKLNGAESAPVQQVEQARRIERPRPEMVVASEDGQAQPQRIERARRVETSVVENSQQETARRVQRSRPEMTAPTTEEGQEQVRPIERARRAERPATEVSEQGAVRRDERPRTDIVTFDEGQEQLERLERVRRVETPTIETTKQEPARRAERTRTVSEERQEQSQRIEQAGRVEIPTADIPQQKSTSDIDASNSISVENSVLRVEAKMSREDLTATAQTVARASYVGEQPRQEQIAHEFEGTTSTESNDIGVE